MGEGTKQTMVTEGIFLIGNPAFKGQGIGGPVWGNGRAGNLSGLIKLRW